MHSVQARATALPPASGVADVAIHVYRKGKLFPAGGYKAWSVNNWQARPSKQVAETRLLPERLSVVDAAPLIYQSIQD